jgi:nicotinamidase-related amidase
MGIRSGMTANDQKSPEGLTQGPLDPNSVHLCVDMQRMFAEPTDWQTPWMPRVLPNILAVAERHPERTVFTRFVPLQHPGEGQGTWRRYYERWPRMTRDQLPPALIGLVPELDRLAPPATVVDKQVYSPWLQTGLHNLLRAGKVDTLVVTGGETEVCVLATVMGAIDFGYRVVVVTDALCSSADETHDAVLEIYHGRFGMQVETATTLEVLDAWR